jgi:acyl-CoA reductase-like NAD-dependent aldehyde dehydrogenase
VYSTRDPVGVVAVITPWNFPLNSPVARSARHWRPATPSCSSRHR